MATAATVLGGIGKRVGGNPSRVQISYPPRNGQPLTGESYGQGLFRSPVSHCSRRSHSPVPASVGTSEYADGTALVGVGVGVPMSVGVWLRRGPASRAALGVLTDEYSQGT